MKPVIPSCLLRIKYDGIVMKNYLKIALQEQKNEAQTCQLSKFVIPAATCLSSIHEWPYQLCAAQSNGDKPSMEDSVDTHMITMWDHAADIKQLANLLYVAIYLLGDLLFFHDTGSTFICMMHYQDNCIIGNLGDSRALLVRKKNNSYRTRRLNQTHRRGNLYEKKRITQEATKWGSKNLDHTYVYRGLGGFNYCPLICYEPEISYFKLPKHGKNTILLCSDGVSDALNEDEINAIFAHHESVTPDLINRFAYHAFKNQQKIADNITSLLYTPQLTQTDITLVCLADGVGDQTVAKLATTLLAKLINPKILATTEKFVSWREQYNNAQGSTTSNDIFDMKNFAKKVIAQCLDPNADINEIVQTWLAKKQQFCPQNTDAEQTIT